MREIAGTPGNESPDLARLRGIEFDVDQDGAPAEVGLIFYEMLRDEQGEIIDGKLIDADIYAQRQLGFPLAMLANRLVTELFGTSSQVQSLIILSRQVMREGKGRCLGLHLPWTEALRASEDNFRAMAEELRETDRRKNEFLAVLSHELRNPLASIQNSLGILERAVPGGEQAKRAKAVIGRQFRHLTRLVDDLLDMTRITQNKIRLQQGRLELRDLVRRTIEDHRALFEQNGVRLEAEYDQVPVHICADSTRLAQVVGNLLHNAAKFTRGGESVYVFVARDVAEKQAIIRVMDTGEGITEEILPQLFQPFMQAETSKDRSGGGLGLGLALSRGLVELHGGEINARSAGLGKGAEFTVRLPLDESGVEEPEALSVGVCRGRRRVLLIEDNTDLAESLRELLELDGHEVRVVRSGTEGLDKAREFKPEILLCDIGLPGMDGYEVARAFRADNALKGVYLVALSGYAQPEDLQRAREAGFDRHLAKPPEPGALEQILESAAR